MTSKEINQKIIEENALLSRLREERKAMSRQDTRFRTLEDEIEITKGVITLLQLEFLDAVDNQLNTIEGSFRGVLRREK